MTTENDFLARVAKDLREKYGNDLSRIAVVFPNKRAALYMNQYLAEAGEGPLWAPTYFTMNDLFAGWSDLQTADDILLTCELFNSYSRFQDEDYNETLDHFFGWGQVLLSDFNDIDKNMVNAKELFANLSDYRAYDQIDYLTPEQKAVLKDFFRDFSEDRITELKTIFKRLWSHLYDIYADYKENLRAKGITYEGAMYRDVVERKDEITYHYDQYVFVGIHAPQKAERELFDKLARDGRALFYWDFDHYYLPKKQQQEHEAGHFIAELLKSYPNELDNQDMSLFGCLSKKKTIRCIAVPTSAMQAHYVGHWLKELQDRVADGRRTAVVLCDEQLLPMVTHGIPPEVSDLNITVGFPLGQTPAATLIRLLFRIYISHRSHGDHFVLKTVKAVLNHPYIQHISEQAPTLLDDLTKKRRNYPTTDELALDEGLSLLFKDIDRDIDSHEENGNLRLSKWLLDVTAYIATHSDNQDPFFKESIYRVYTCVNRLKGLVEQGYLQVDPVTFERLIEQVITTTKIPFHGEPVVGLQVMGLLETRNLDFDHLLVLSCNEGKLPKQSDAPSFIPYLLREAFSLPTQSHTVSVYAYHFYRMLQRAGDITLVYGNVTDNINSGEMSRFLSQLMVESPHAIQKLAIQPKQQSHPPKREAIAKSDAVIEKMNAMTRISPTAINTYLRCGLRFYYEYILGIREPDAEDDDIDNRLFGTLFHETAQLIYESLVGKLPTGKDPAVFTVPGREVSKDQLAWVLKKESGVIERAMNEAFERSFFKDKRKGQHDEYNGLQLINRQVIAHYVRRLIEMDQTLGHLSIRGMEGDVRMKVAIGEGSARREIAVGGYIDRMDEVDSDASDVGRCIRVVDYKTGTKMPEIEHLDQLFDGEHLERHSDYLLQVMLYATIIRHSDIHNPRHLPVSPCLLFIQKMNKENPDPVIYFKEAEQKNIYDIEPYMEIFKEKLSALLTEIFDPSHPFLPTKVAERCVGCPLWDMCGRKE